MIKTMLIAASATCAIALLMFGILYARAPIPKASGPFTIAQLDGDKLTQRWHNAEQAQALVADNRPTLRFWYPEDNNQAPLPLLLYFASGAVDNQNLIEDLTSQGFAVLAIIDNQYQSFDFSSAETFQATQENADSNVTRRAQAAIAVTDWLQQQPDALPVTVPITLDMDRIGLFGYSFNGASAAQACRMDNRFQAVVNFDGWLFGDAAREGVPCNFMMWTDSSPVPTDADLNAAEPSHRFTALLSKQTFDSLYQHLPVNGGLLLSLANSGHRNFADHQLSSLIRRIGWPGRITGARAASILNRYVAAYFHETLNGKSASLLQTNNPEFPEVSLQRWNAHTVTDNGGVRHP